MPSSLYVTVRSLGFSGALGSVSWSCVLRCSLRWAFSACFSCRCRSFCRFAKVVRELPAISTPILQNFLRGEPDSPPFSILYFMRGRRAPRKQFYSLKNQHKRRLPLTISSALLRKQQFVASHHNFYRPE